MRTSARPARVLAALLALFACGLGAASAQEKGAGLCNPRPAAPRGALVLDCPGGLTLTAEAGAVFTINDVDSDGTPEGADLSKGALLVEGAAFEVSTPEAIAAVRGTTWAIDASAAKTAVFVETGEVEVARRGGDGASVRLRDGEGVDVTAEAGPLDVRRWSAARVSALFARLGRP